MPSRRPRRPLLSPYLLAIILGTVVLGAAPAGAVEPFRISTGDACSDAFSPALAARPGGGAVVTWGERGEAGSDVSSHPVARLYEAGAVPVGEPFAVGEETSRLVDPAVAVRPDGSFAISWGHGVPTLRLYSATAESITEPRLLTGLFGANETDVAVTPEGNYVVLSTGIDSTALGGLGALHLVSPQGERLAEHLAAWVSDFGVDAYGPTLAADGERVHGALQHGFGHVVSVRRIEDVEVQPEGSFGVAPAAGADLALLPDGRTALVWTALEGGELDESDAPIGIYLAVATPDGALSDPVRVDDGGWQELSPASVAADSAGRLAVTWAEAGGDGSLSLRIRGFTPDGQSAGPVRRLHRKDAGDGGPWNPEIAWTGNEWTVVWQGGPAPGFPLTACLSTGIWGAEVVAPQLFDSPALTLQGGRFEARVAWRDPYNGGSGVGHPLPLTGDTGTFWFFREGNRELMVKVLDGRGVNGNWWVFYGSTTTVGFDLVVTDTETGEEAVYRNPPFQLASRGDTAAFPAAAEAAEAAVGEWAAPAEPLPGLPPSRLAGPLTPIPPAVDCDDPNEPALCLGDDYVVTVRWFDPFNGGSGEGWGVPLSDDSGYFWFFDEDNAELLVKILPGTPVNGHDWVFYGSLTNVAFEMRVNERSSGFERLYRNPPREFHSVGDTLAFPPVAGCGSQCPAGGEPVCGSDGLTYDNACLAECSGRTVRHPGECTWAPPE